MKNDGLGLDYFISPADETSKEDIPVSHSAGYIACVIGAAHGTKHGDISGWHFVKKLTILLFCWRKRRRF